MTEREFLEHVLLGDRQAVDFVEMLGQISQVWDDIVDEPHSPPSAADINKAFWTALVGVQMNPFFNRHRDVLMPVLHMAVVDWMDSNNLERGSKHDKTLAFVLRDTLVSVVVLCAELVGGWQHAREVGPNIRRFFYSEHLDQYLEDKRG